MGREEEFEEVKEPGKPEEFSEFVLDIKHSSEKASAGESFIKQR